MDQTNRQYIADNVPQALSAILKTCRKCTNDVASMDKQKEEIVYNMMVRFRLFAYTLKISLSGLALNPTALAELQRLEAPAYISGLVIDSYYDIHQPVIESSMAALWNITLQKEHRKTILKVCNLFQS
jgi:hypothetical protein